MKRIILVVLIVFQCLAGSQPVTAVVVFVVVLVAACAAVAFKKFFYISSLCIAQSRGSWVNNSFFGRNKITILATSLEPRKELYSNHEVQKFVGNSISKYVICSFALELEAGFNVRSSSKE